MLSRLGLLGAVFDLGLSFLDFLVGVNRPAANREGFLDLVVSAIMQNSVLLQGQLQQQLVINDKGDDEHYPQNCHCNNKHITVVIRHRTPTCN